MATRGPDPKVSDDALLQAIRNAPGPVASSREVADAVGLSRQRVYERLTGMRDDGIVGRKKIGGQVIVWWLQD